MLSGTISDAFRYQRQFPDKNMFWSFLNPVNSDGMTASNVDPVFWIKWIIRSLKGFSDVTHLHKYYSGILDRTKILIS